MQPIIQRTLTITVTESWTITWQDGQETTWHTTREVAWPAVGEPGTSLSPVINAAEGDDEVLDPDAADPLAADG